MQRACFEKALRNAKVNRQQRIWRSISRMMACVVFFCTTFMLMLPAATMEKSQCGLSEHTHSENCYNKVISEPLVLLSCTYESLGVHTHTSDCVDGNGNLICGQADYVVHEHNADCMDGNGTVVCRIPAAGAHEHTDSCYTAPETEPAETESIHSHGEACYAVQRGDMICQLTETEGHTHGESCSVRGEQICQLSEEEGHAHGEACFETVLLCSTEVEPHIHGEDCYRQLVCEISESEDHTHTEECTGTVRICDLTEQPHTHAEGCWEKRSICSLPESEGHSHNAACYEPLTICGLEERPAHQHTDDCFETVTVLLCEEETAGEERKLICSEPVAPVHIHSEDCFTEADVQDILTCELPEDENHTHVVTCYGTWEFICTQSEHVHTEECADEAEQETETENEPNTLCYQGMDYRVELRYDDLAGIPEGARLEVTELTGEAYQDHLERAYKAMGYKNDRVLVQFAGEEDSQTVSSEEAAVVSGPITFARFFDLSILAGDEKIEPANTVEITIRYDEAVQIPEGEKIAVHFTDSGEVEVLNAEAAMPMMLMSGRSTLWVEETADETYAGEEFVFLQDSFSVTGTVTMGAGNGNVDITYDGSTTVAWSCLETEVRTLTVMAEFDDTEEGKSIIIKIPTGFQITSYSATEATPAIEGVTKVEIDGEFKDYVLSSVLKPASLHGNIAGVRAGDTWATQVIKGYTPWEGSVERDVRTYGGDIEYQLAPGTQHVKVVVTLHINSRLLSHTASTEQMEPIQIITTSATETHTSRIVAEATDIPVVGLYYSTEEGGAEEHKVAEKGDVSGRSAIIPIKANSTNYKKGEHGSYFDSAAFTLTYPEGVFLEPDSLFCKQVAMYLGKIKGLIKNGTKEVLKDHLSVEWIENENGGGTVTWHFTKTYYYHGGPTFGADFTANTDTSKAPYYRAGDTITGFSLSGEFERNGKKGTIPPLPYVRTLVAADGSKDIRLIPRNFTRRDITEDFRTTEYDYVLGGFNVYSSLRYLDNTFWFENTDGLNITALGLMGKNIRDITVVTNKGNVYTLPGLSESGTSQGAVYSGTLLELSAMGGQEDEYITGCLFTTDMEQGNYAYVSDYISGSFVYYGQFQDGDNDGSREGSVTLRQLEDNTTYQEVQAAIQNGSLDETLVMCNAGDDSQYGGKPIMGTDHTKIGWYNTGVNSVATSVVNTDTNNSEDVYYIGDELRFTSEIRSGSVVNTQNMLIDPVLVISLPEGITLNTASVTATSAAGIGEGAPVRLVQDGEATENVIDGVTWTTYRFKSPEMLTLVAEEQNLDNVFRPRNCITATFDAVVDPGCDQYNLSTADLVMWDVRNTAYETDTLQTVTTNSMNGDAAHSSSGANFTHGDRYNVLGHGTAYAVASDTGTVIVKPLINLYVDLGIKSISSRDIPITNSGFTTYNGLPGSVVSVIPGRYVDVQLKYISTSTTPYYEGTAIYVPVPKMGEDYAKYFENIELDDPMNVQKTKTFNYTMDLTGPVNLVSGDGDEWITRYAVRQVSSNPNDYSIENQGWEPVVQNGGAVQWLTAEQVTDWAAVAMIKFVSTADIESQETGSGVMRLYVHDVNDPYGPARAGGVNYWRGYCKAVVDETDHSGNWKYTSVVAATPAVETLVGQIFIDEDHDGVFDSGEPSYSPGAKPYAYTAELSRNDGTMAVQALAVKSDGSFALLDSQGNPVYLPVGEYTVTIRKNAEPNFRFVNTGSAIGGESTETVWYNNVSGRNDAVAVWKFTVENNRQGVFVHRVGVGLKAGVSAVVEGVKTFSNGSLQAGDYGFKMEASTQGAPVPESPARNAADGSFSFGTLWYEFPGTYVYHVAEDCNNPKPGVIYDGHVTIVTITVTGNSNGVLAANVAYDNSAATTAEDRAVTDKAAFTNAHSYELPETGGAGAAAYTIGGMLFITTALAAYIQHLRRRKERRRPF